MGETINLLGSLGGIIHLGFLSEMLDVLYLPSDSAGGQPGSVAASVDGA